MHKFTPLKYIEVLMLVYDHNKCLFVGLMFYLSSTKDILLGVIVVFKPHGTLHNLNCKTPENTIDKSEETTTIPNKKLKL